MRIYYDMFRCDYVDESHLNKQSRPSRYYEVLLNQEDVFIEEWYCGKDKYVSLSYTEEDLENIDTIREIKEKALNVKFLYMVSYCVPRKVFNEAMKKVFKNGTKI